MIYFWVGTQFPLVPAIYFRKLFFVFYFYKQKIYLLLSFFKKIVKLQCEVLKVQGSGGYENN